MSTPTTAAATRLSVMDVAKRLRVRYQKARDLMLTGKLGETQYDGHRLTATESGVQNYLDQQKAKRKR